MIRRVLLIGLIGVATFLFLTWVERTPAAGIASRIVSIATAIVAVLTVIRYINRHSALVLLLPILLFSPLQAQAQESWAFTAASSHPPRQ